MKQTQSEVDLSLTRRQFGKLSASAFLLGAMAGLPTVSLAANPTGKKLHGISAFGELGYAPDYAHFNFINPDAPKGGTFNFGVPNWAFNQNPQTFDTLNSFILKGNAPPRMELCYDTLMVRAIDEPTALYGALAESVEISEDRNSYTFILRPEAKWHDGTPITAEDVAFSYDALKKDGHPQISIILIRLEKAEALDARTVKLTFDGQQSDRAILTATVLPILSKAYYADRSFSESTMDVPLGSGPYRVKDARPGSSIEYERVDDYWAKDMPFSRGLYNFDILRIEFYRERQAAFEAFKKGNITYREEFTSKTWATEYDFPALKEGRVKQQLFPQEKVPGFQAWAVNRRLPKFADNRTVEAIAHCFDFEWTNENLFYGAYKQSQSFFENSEFIATGKPEGAELELLKSLTAKVDDAVLTDTVVMQPISNGSGRDRKLLRKANGLLRDAGWKRDGTKMVDDKGEQLSVEFLIRSPTFERILAKFVSNLGALGIAATIRLVDPAQFQKRIDTYDFDAVGLANSFGASPSYEILNQFFSSDLADREGNRNYPGIKNPVIDELLAKVRTVNSREELTIILRALDRVLRSTHSWIPNWTSANHRVAYWDMFGIPPTKPDYAFPVETMWWLDAEKAKAIDRG